MSTLETIFLLIWALALFATGVWASRAKPPREFMQRYEKEMLRYRVIPFLYNPEKKIDPVDLPLFLPYKRRSTLYRTIIFVPLIGLYVYLYFKYIHPV